MLIYDITELENVHVLIWKETRSLEMRLQEVEDDLENQAHKSVRRKTQPASSVCDLYLDTFFPTTSVTKLIHACLFFFPTSLSSYFL